mgnify:CR=1 FL=1
MTISKRKRDASANHTHRRGVPSHRDPRPPSGAGAAPTPLGSRANYFTSTVPFMFGCRPQLYSYTPGAANAWV